MGELSKNLPLNPAARDLLLLDDILLVQRLNSIKLFCRLMLAQHNLAESPPPEHFEDSKILDGNVLLLQTVLITLRVNDFD
jgi:hypothetical protein